MVYIYRLSEDSLLGEEAFLGGIKGLSVIMQLKGLCDKSAVVF